MGGEAGWLVTAFSYVASIGTLWQGYINQKSSHNGPVTRAGPIMLLAML